MKNLLLLLAAAVVSAGGLFAQCGTAPHCVVLTWTAPATGSAPTSYNVKRATSSGAEVTVATVTAPTVTYTDLSATGNVLTEGTTYFYQVTSVNAGGESAPSNETFARIPTSIPSAPTGLGSTAH